MATFQHTQDETIRQSIMNGEIEMSTFKVGDKVRSIYTGAIADVIDILSATTMYVCFPDGSGNTHPSEMRDFVLYKESQSASPAIEAESLPEVLGHRTLIALYKKHIAELEAQLAAANAENAKHAANALKTTERVAHLEEAIEFICEAMQTNIKDKDVTPVWMLQSWYSSLSKAYNKQSPVKKCDTCKKPLSDDTAARFGSHGAIYLCPLCTEELES